VYSRDFTLDTDTLRMKALVTLIQLAVVAAIFYPVYYFWDTGRIENFCEGIKPGMTIDQLNALADESYLSLNTPTSRTEGSAQWMTSVESKASLDRYACVVIGAVDRVATAHLVDEE
jgi:hypothetical protein